MAVSYYERKILERSTGVMASMGISYELVTAGTLKDKRAICLVLDRFTKEEKINELIQNLQKCFRKADVVRGKGTHRPCAKEITYPNIYIIIKGANK
jgi:hypothetical protein